MVVLLTAENARKRGSTDSTIAGFGANLEIATERA